MGVDCVGIKPKNKNGEYFRNSWWMWRRLWDFCCHITPRIPRYYGEYNDGDIIQGNIKMELELSLEKALKEKSKYGRWIKENAQAYAEVSGGKCKHIFVWSNVEEFYSFVKGNEGFQIW